MDEIKIKDFILPELINHLKINEDYNQKKIDLEVQNDVISELINFINKHGRYPTKPEENRIYVKLRTKYINS